MTAASVASAAMSLRDGDRDRDCRNLYGLNVALIAAARLMSPSPTVGEVPGSAMLFDSNSLEKERSLVPGSGSMLGLGLKTRPAQLTLSPSDGALNLNAKAVSDPQEGEGEEERGALSEVNSCFYFFVQS